MPGESRVCIEAVCTDHDVTPLKSSICVEPFHGTEYLKSGNVAKKGCQMGIPHMTVLLRYPVTLVAALLKIAKMMLVIRCFTRSCMVFLSCHCLHILSVPPDYLVTCILLAFARYMQLVVGRLVELVDHYSLRAIRVDHQ